GDQASVGAPRHGLALAFDPGRFPSCLGIPDPDQAITRGTGEPAAVPAPGKPRRRPLARNDRAAYDDVPELASTIGVPDPDPPFGADGRETFPIGSENGGQNKLPVPAQLVPDAAIRQADQI